MSTAAAGTQFETRVVDYLRAAGLDARKPLQTHWYDVGDIWVGEGTVLQAKAHRDILAGIRDGIAGAEEQAGRAHRRYGFAVVKRPGKPTGDAYVVVRLATLVTILRELEGSDAAHRA